MSAAIAPVVVPLAKAYRLLNHGPVTLVSSALGDRSNVMAASWAMPLDFDPPKVVVVVDKNTLTRQLMEASGEFALSIPSRQLAAEVLKAGTLSGKDGDKWATSGLQNFPAEIITAPLVADCVGWLECRIISEPRNQEQYDLFIGEVVAAQADPRVFSDGHWHFEGNDERLRTLHYVADGHFLMTGDAFDVIQNP
ncbi:MAG TPA: flavin reductase family protein [Rhodocyclaceae bacterium]|jgi:flavin reductase (DIM6/NTAB) family NADH-FMN oxidoreductase RutF